MAEATLNQQTIPAADGQGMITAAARQINPIDAVAQSRAVRHFGKLIGLAAAVAIGMAVVLWSAEPNYRPLYDNLSGKDAAQIADALMSRDIDFKLDPGSGTLLVDQSRISEARLLLASQGLTGESRKGMGILQEDQGLGTSQLMESARYKHALEEELMRSVESIREVESARVHLAIPKQSIFIRNKIKPSASVVVRLHSGRVLNPGQVEAIVQMIASSVPRLESSEVKVVDQFGRLLSADANKGMAQTTRHYEFSRNLENGFADRIISLLQPIVGEGKVNAQVAAQLDFSSVESTREAFDPERSVIRSEQSSEQGSSNIAQAIGIPGALSNQPAAGGSIETGQPGNQATTTTGSQNRSSTRNFEVDRVISHTNNPVGSILRLSVAVVIDNKLVTNEEGSVEKVAYSDEEMARFESLVKETIGFDANRGDSVSVINTSFLEIETPVIAEIPWWQSLQNEVWIVNLIKQVLGAIGLIIVYFVLGRPLIRALSLNRDATNSSESGVATGSPMPMQQAVPGPYMAAQQVGIPNLAEDPNSPAAMVRRKDATYEQKVDMARSMVMDNPARVANVMRQWTSE